MINLYSDKSRYKLIIVLIALLIGSGSVYYTNFIVKQLAEREEAQVKLYAKELQFLISRSGEDENGTLDLFLSEMIQSNNTIPTIWVNDEHKILDSKNIEFPSRVTLARKKYILAAELEIMAEEHPPNNFERRQVGRDRFYLLSQLVYAIAVTLFSFHPTYSHCRFCISHLYGL